MKTSQLSINSVSLDFEDFERSLKAVRSAGFGKIEFALHDVKEFLRAGHRREEVRELLDRNNLRCIGGFETQLNCFAGDNSENWARHLENAQLLSALGGTAMVVGTDGPSDAMQAEEIVATLANGVREVCRRIAPFGVSLLIEFNWSPVVKSLRTAAEIVRQSGEPNAGVLFDPAHYHCTQTKFDQLTKANVAAIRHVHVNDMKDKPGELSHCNDDRVLPGRGCLDLHALFGEIERQGYEGDFSIEMFDPELRKLPPEMAAAQMYKSLLPFCAH